jgi:hypothetical protein
MRSRQAAGVHRRCPGAAPNGIQLSLGAAPGIKCPILRTNRTTCILLVSATVPWLLACIVSIGHSDLADLSLAGEAATLAHVPNREERSFEALQGMIKALEVLESEMLKVQPSASSSAPRGAPAVEKLCLECDPNCSPRQAECSMTALSRVLGMHALSELPLRFFQPHTSSMTQ